MSAISDFFHRLSNLPDLVHWAGLAGLAIIIFSETGLLLGVFLPGDSLLVTAGLLAASGQFHINIYWLATLLTMSAVMGNSTGYWIGRTTGPRVFSRTDSILFNKKHATRAREFFERYGRKTIVVAQFMPIIRTFSPVVCGVGGVRFRFFFSFNVIGAITWIWSMLFIGFFLGRYIPGVDRHIEIVVLIVITVSIMPGIIGGARARQRKRTKAAAVVTESPGPA